jgi:ribosomal silencing factor RsfS
MKLKKPKDNIETISIARLRELHDEHVTQQAANKRAVEAIKSELLRRYKDDALTEIHSRGNEHGECTLSKDGIKVLCEVDNKVTWDTEKLKAIAATLPSDTVKRLFKVVITVPETVFKSITEKDLLDKVTDARTVRYSEPKFSFPTNE